MRSQEILLQLCTEICGDILDRYAGRICRDNAIGLYHLFNLGKQVLLYFEVLDDDLNNPVHIR